jgi:hypothetical protein
MLSLAVQRPSLNRSSDKRKYAFTLRSSYGQAHEPIEFVSEQPFVVCSECLSYGIDILCDAYSGSDARLYAKYFQDDPQFQGVTLRVVAGTLIR